MHPKIDIITERQVIELVERLAISKDSKNILVDNIKERIDWALKSEVVRETDHLIDYVKERWLVHRIGEDTPVSFIQRVYARWLGSGLSKSHIREVDPQLYRAFYNWAARHELPDGFSLPTQREVSDAVVAQATGQLLGNNDFDPLANSSQARKLLNALRYRDTKSKLERER